jgi:hypothetical protein
MISQRICRVAACSLALAALDVARAQCLDWKPGFGLPGGGVFPGIYAQVVFDDGTGPALFVAGDITQAGSASVHHIAKWNGASWSALGSGLESYAEALAVFDDGSGPALYVGGWFTNAGGLPTQGIARWNGTSWSALGSGVNGAVNALAVFDDGSGPALYAGGTFDQADGVPVHNLARWDGSSWSDVGGGLSNVVYSLIAYDDATGPALFVGGEFYTAGQTTTGGLAKWNGTAWSALAGIVNGFVYALSAYDDGTGSALYMAGNISGVGTQPFRDIARWNGSTWSPLGAGIDTTMNGGSVYALAVFNDGLGAQLYAGGTFVTAGGLPAMRVARWNGAVWSPVGSGTDGVVHALGVFDDGSGAELYVSGGFAVAGGVACSSIARFGASGWSGLGNAPHHGIAGTVNALALFDDGTGVALYAGGSFGAAGSTVAHSIAKWNGASWSALGVGVGGFVNALAVFDDGHGAALYAGGTFATAGGIFVYRIARWDGVAWSALGSGVGGVGDSVSTMLAFDDGSGPALYVGGQFGFAGGNNAGNIARWNGTTWSSVGGGMGDPVDSLAVFDDGSGPKLYAGGMFSSAGGHTVLHIARWDGTSWSAVGGGIGYAGSSEDVNALVVYDDGTGPALIAGGRFFYADGHPVDSIAKWNGTSWSTFGHLYSVTALTQFDDGSGPALYAGDDGEYNFLRWNGAAWTTVGGGVSAPVLALAAFDDGTSGGPDLYLGGAFTVAGSVASQSIAEWRGCAGPGTLYCFGDGSVAPCPCHNSGQLEHGCENSASTGGAVLASAGHTHPDTVVLAVMHELPSALSIYLQGDASLAPVPFGDGLRCAGGSLKRLYVQNASGGVGSVPAPGDPPISTRSAELGDPIAPGSVRYYQTYYRDPNPSFCPSPTGNTWNVTNGVRIQW